MTTTQTLAITKPSPTEILVTRRFAAPRAHVFRACTEPALVERWMSGPAGWHMTRCTIDLRVGGAQRFEVRHDDGRTMGWGGVFREVAAPERLVHTEAFDEDWTGGEALVTIVFTEEAGETTMAMTIAYSSEAARDGALASGMASGMEESYARLDGLLPAVRS